MIDKMRRHLYSALDTAIFLGGPSILSLNENEMFWQCMFDYFNTATTAYNVVHPRHAACGIHFIGDNSVFRWLWNFKETSLSCGDQFRVAIDSAIHDKSKGEMYSDPHQEIIDYKIFRKEERGDYTITWLLSWLLRVTTKDIFIFGLDFDFNSDVTHWYDPIFFGATKISYAQGFNALEKQLNEKFTFNEKKRIFNCNPDSKCEAFQKLNFNG